MFLKEAGVFLAFLLHGRVFEGRDIVFHVTARNEVTKQSRNFNNKISSLAPGSLWISWALIPTWDNKAPKAPSPTLTLTLHGDLSHRGRGQVPVLAVRTSPLVGEVDAQQSWAAGEGCFLNLIDVSLFLNH